MVENPPANAGDTRDMGRSWSQEDSLEEGMAPHASTLAWRIPLTEESTVHDVAKSWTRLSDYAAVLSTNTPLSHTRTHLSY